MVAAKRWPTIISKEEFKGVTGFDNFPDYLQKDIKDGKLNVFANGEMVYQIKGYLQRYLLNGNTRLLPEEVILIIQLCMEQNVILL